jgi:hypothetical protein
MNFNHLISPLVAPSLKHRFSRLFTSAARPELSRRRDAKSIKTMRKFQVTEYTVSVNPESKQEEEKDFPDGATKNDDFG